MAPVLEGGLANTPKNSWLLNMYGLMLLNTGAKERAQTYFLEAMHEAEKLTPEEWGASYPGNDPQSYALGLQKMQEAIQHNYEKSLQ